MMTISIIEMIYFAHVSQEFDNHEDPRAYPHKDLVLALLGLYYPKGWIVIKELTIYSNFST
jgi:hypothetical protein